LARSERQVAEGLARFEVSLKVQCHRRGIVRRKIEYR
jgi:hypothetical protein